MKQAKKADPSEASPVVAEVDPLTVNHRDAAGLDIDSASVWVSVPADREAEPVRQFGMATPDWIALAEWLKACGIKTIAMESTGVYWNPPYEILEERGVKVYLVNARHAKNVPGRKKDEADAQWLRRLHTFGLRNNSFRPTGEICARRAYRRHRAMLIEHRAAQYPAQAQGTAPDECPLVSHRQGHPGGKPGWRLFERDPSGWLTCATRGVPSRKPSLSRR